MPGVLPARKNAARLRFNSESGSSLKSRRPSTCGLVNDPCSDTEPARFKTQTCGFFWAARGRRSARATYKPAADRLRTVISAIFDVTNPFDNRI